MTPLTRIVENCIAEANIAWIGPRFFALNESDRAQALGVRLLEIGHGRDQPSQLRGRHVYYAVIRQYGRRHTLVFPRYRELVRWIEDHESAT